MLQRDGKTKILLTGASGFIGRYLLDYFKDRYSVIAIARRSATEAGLPFHPDVRWIQWNISNKLTYSDVMGYLIGSGGADIVIHLAGYYDYEYNDNPEYKRTNITGTRNVLDLARHLDVKHFIFASSLAACKFPGGTKKVNEHSPADAEFDYARSKREGEALCGEYARYFKCSVVRFAAIFSDWCEYAPLYQFLSTWLSKKWDASILGGHGNSAISYLHINDLARLFLSLIRKTDSLPSFATYIASPDGSTTHKDLFYAATRDFYGNPRKPFFIPKYLALPGIVAKRALGGLNLASTPFEKFWMVKYIDLRLNVDAALTRKRLSWEPTPRYHILRRLIFLLDKMKSHPNEWHLKNEAAQKRNTYRPNLVIYEILVKEQEKLELQIINEILEPANGEKFRNYRKMKLRDLKVAVSIFYHLILAAIRSSDRSIMLKYLDDIALRRFAAGFSPAEVTSVLGIFDRVLRIPFESKKGIIRNLEQELYDHVSLSIQLACDQIEDAFENLEMKFAEENLALLRLLADDKKKHDEVKQLSAFYQEFREESSKPAQKTDPGPL